MTFTKYITARLQVRILHKCRQLYVAPSRGRDYRSHQTYMCRSHLLGSDYNSGRHWSHVLLETDVRAPGFSPPFTTLQRHLASGLRLVRQPRQRLADCHSHKVRRFVNVSYSLQCCYMERFRSVPRINYRNN